MADPVGQADPAGHWAHSLSDARLLALPNEPSEQGSGAAEPSLQYDPGVQASQLTLPARAWNSPAGQASHVAAPSTGLTVPGAQSVAFAEPTGQKLPAGQVMHWPTLVITGRLVS